MNKIQRENYLGKKYISGLPKWLRYLIFLKTGLYNGGGWKIKLGRIFCWFDRHKLTHIYPIKRVDCVDCGFQVKLEEINN